MAALPIRLGVTTWAAAGGLCVVLAAGLLGYRAHLIELGVKQEAARRDVIQAERDHESQEALRQANARVALAQTRLDATLADLDKLQTELSHVKTDALALQSDLAAGRRRLPVMVQPTTADTTRTVDGTCAARLDPGAAVAAELEPAVAAGLAGLAAEGDAAIVRLNACIAAYDAVKRAADETD